MRSINFAIVTVSLNDSGGLQRTFESICEQRHRNYEWIVVDGGSRDGTRDFLESRTEEFVTWLSERDSGIYDAMNKGIEMSSGEYLLFLNAGDVFSSPEVLGVVWDEVCRTGGPDVVFGGSDYVFYNGSSIYRPPKVVSHSIWHGLPANHQATYYSRKALGELTYDLTYRICGDYYIIAKLYAKGVRAAYVKQSLVKFLVGGMSYQNRLPLFIEPYRIQRDVLGCPLHWRVASLFRRLIATIAMASLQRVHRNLR